MPGLPRTSDAGFGAVEGVFDSDQFRSASIDLVKLARTVLYEEEGRSPCLKKLRPPGAALFFADSVLRYASRKCLADKPSLFVNFSCQSDCLAWSALRLPHALFQSRRSVRGSVEGRRV